MSEPTNKSMQWPDLASYGVTLGVVEMEAGRKSLVFSDETGKYAHIARGMGFSRTRWPGLWVRNDVRIEASSFRSAFPNLQIQQKTAGEIAQTILTKIGERVGNARQQELPGFSVSDSAQVQVTKTGRGTRKPKADSGPAPTATPQATSADASGSEGVMVDISPLSVDNIPLGFNRLGEEVFQAPDGRRFSRIETLDGAKIRREAHLSFPDPEEAGMFLRGDTPEALERSAEGLVWAMAHGRTVRVEDFAQFFRATMGRDLAKSVASDPDFDRVVAAVDRARVRGLAQVAINPDADAFAAALRLHDAAQYYSLISESRMTPLPIAVAIQHMAMSMPKGASVRIANADRGEFSILSQGYFTEAQEGQGQDILLGAYEGKLLDRSVETMGTMVSRDDHAQTLKMLEKMSADGLGIFLVDGDQMPGRIGPSSRRFLDTLATHHKVEGMVDVDGMLMGIPGGIPKRIIVVGAKNATPQAPVLPDSVPFVTDYESFWRWGDRISESIRKPGSVPLGERGGIASQEGADQLNSYQSPYIPTSTLSEPTLMVPRNLASPLRRAMIEIQRTTPHTDQWLAEQLQMTMDELRDALSPEQADAVVMAIKRMESGMGFMVADQTGTGKGRILAATALYQRLKGEPVVFLTEKAELFTDFWRDIENIGAQRHFKNIFILNDGVKVISPKTEALVAESAPRDVVDATLKAMELPKGADLVMATYSQFNRDPIKATRARGDIDVDALTKNEISAAVQSMIARVKAWRKAEGKAEVKDVTVDAVDLFSNKELVQKLPTEALKPIWIARCMKGANLIMDESHNMSGEDSQTAMNLVHSTMNAKTVMYSSATFARGEKNMRAYRRLFPASVDVEALHDTLKRGGEPLQEALSSMLAEDGALVRREHDLSMLKFMPQIDKKNTVRNEEYADKLAEILAAMGALTREVREYSDSLSETMKAAIVAANSVPGNAPVSATAAGKMTKNIGVLKRSSIGNNLYTTMRSFLTIIKNDLVVERAVANLKEGRKPGIIIEHTMEADLNRAVEYATEKGLTKETDEGIIMKAPSFRTLLMRMLEDMSQVSLDGKDLELQKSPAFASIIRMIEEKINEFPNLPLCPLDYVRKGIEDAGYTCVELSGRKRDMVPLGDGNVLVRKIPKGARGKAKERFNNGDADAILLTRAGNAGISLHASPTFLNTQQRVVIEAEVPEDVVVRVQFFGRFNRKDQMSHPVIETLSSDLPAENRILALQNNKLRKMSANVTANRDNEAITKDIADIINVVGNEVAFKFFELRPELAVKLDVGMPDAAERLDEDFQLRGEKYVAQLFSKMVMLPVIQQREIIKEVSQEFTATIEELEARGENPLRAKFYDVHAKKTGSETLEYGSVKVINDNAPKTDSVFDRPVLITGIEYSDSYKQLPKEELMKMVFEGRDKLIDSISDVYGAEFALAVKKDPETLHDYVVDTVIEMRDSLMEHAKAARHTSVADALAEKDNNMVKIIQWKTDKIVEVMSGLRIGSTIHLNDPLWQRPVTGVVTGMSVPKEKDLCAPGRYFVKFASPGRPFAEKVSLAQLIEDKHFSVLEQKASKRTLEAFDTTNAETYTVKRNVLDGNLFRAAEASIQAGVGTQALFSDEHGMANRAVVLPTGINKKSFEALPLRITDVELATRFLKDVATGTLVSTASSRSENFSKSWGGIALEKTKNEIIVTMPGNQSRQAWLKNNHEVMAITGPFAGSRNKIFAVVQLDQGENLMRALYKAGVSMYAHPQSPVHRNEVDVKSYTYRYMRTDDLQKAQGVTNARQWFIEALNMIDDAKVTSTNQLKAKDPMAGLDGGTRLKAA
jgi:C-terminal domain on Strawberry notch homologue/P-loop containing NTP hydrolase pore-1